MPAVVEPPVRGFALTDFTEIPNPPPDDGPAADPNAGKPDTAATEPTVIEEPPIKPLVDDEPEKPDDKPADKPDEDAPDSLQAAMNRAPGEAAKKAEADRITAEKKATDDAAAAEAEKAKAASQPPPPTERDADLKDDPGAHTHPKTRKIITEIKAKTKAARDERDAIIKERDTLKAERDQFAEKAKGVTLPKEVEEEVKTLRERVRELDITKDPILEAKYDRKIATNNQSIIDTLKAQGFGMTQGEGGKMVENPKAIAELVKSGLTLKQLNPLIKKLEEADLIDEAESIRESVRQNNRLAAEKNQEIESWKADYGKRQQTREQQTKQQSEQRQADYTQQTDAQYRAEIARLEKDIPYLKQPPAPLATDTPAVAKAKQTALDEFNAAAKRIETDIRELNPEGAPPEKQSEIVGRINANAILAVALKSHVIPKFVRDMQARDARIKELEGELGKIRDAGKLSRLQGSAPGGDTNAGKPEYRTLEDAFKAASSGDRQG